ncbi:MAG TPA: hypothetical protein VGH79_03295 [Gaiellaceae bacterium]|jgi:hypothetical protein
MKRVLLLLFAAVLLSACAGARNISEVRPAQMHASVRAIAAFREHHATLKANNLIRRIPLPAGAHPTPVPPSLRTSNLGVSVLTQFAYVHRAVLIPKPLGVIARYVKANPVPGFENHTGSLNSLGFDREPAHSWPMQRMYELSYAPAARHGWTVVKEEAAAAWIYPRSPQEKVPRGVREIDIRGGGVDQRVTDRAKVAQIVQWFDGLNVAPSGVVVSCMINLSTQLNFVFSRRGGTNARNRDRSVGGFEQLQPGLFQPRRAAHRPPLRKVRVRQPGAAFARRLLPRRYAALPLRTSTTRSSAPSA